MLNRRLFAEQEAGQCAVGAKPFAAGKGLTTDKRLGGKRHVSIVPLVDVIFGAVATLPARLQSTLC